MTATQASGSTEAQKLRAAIHALGDQLCQAVDGQFDFVVHVDMDDDAVQKLQTLINFVLDASRRSLGESDAQRLALEIEVAERRHIQDIIKAASARQTALNELQHGLLGPGEVREKLGRITTAAVEVLGMDFCRIWVTRAGDLCQSGCVHASAVGEQRQCQDRDQCLHLWASSGRYTHTDGIGHRRVPLGCYKIGQLASGAERKLVTNHVLTDPHVHDHQWARELGLVSFAGYQLRPPGGDTIGVFAGFSREIITPDTDAALEALAATAARVILSDVAAEEQKALHVQLTESQRLESVGQLAAGIAHEINTPTQFVSDNARFLRNAFPKLTDLLGKYQALADACRTNTASADMLSALEQAVRAAKLDYLLEQIPEALSDSLEGLERVTKIVRAMKDFAHPGQESAAPADLNKAIESTVTVARNEWKYVADLTLDLDPDLPPVPCLLGDFNQVILNIVVNAAHAIKDVVGDGSQAKGTIAITTRYVEEQAEIRIRDTGTGIPEQHRARIFDHFFTTKEVGKGTGQGLSLARRVIVEKHGGTLTFETETGRGTTFIIRLPIQSEAETAAAAEGGSRNAT